MMTLDIVENLPEIIILNAFDTYSSRASIKRDKDNKLYLNIHNDYIPLNPDFFKDIKACESYTLKELKDSVVGLGE